MRAGRQNDEADAAASDLYCDRLLDAGLCLRQILSSDNASCCLYFLSQRLHAKSLVKMQRIAQLFPEAWSCDSRCSASAARICVTKLMLHKSCQCCWLLSMPAYIHFVIPLLHLFTMFTMLCDWQK